MLLTRPEVLKLVTLHTSTLYSLMREGKFPKPVKLGEGKNAGVRWYEDEVKEWIASRPRASIGGPQDETKTAARG